MSMVYLYDRRSEITEKIAVLQNSISEYENVIREFQNQAYSAEEMTSESRRIDSESTALINDIFSAISCEGMQTGIASALSNVGSKNGKNCNRISVTSEEQIRETQTVIQRKREEIRQLEEEARRLDIGMPY